MSYTSADTSCQFLILHGSRVNVVLNGTVVEVKTHVHFGEPGRRQWKTKQKPKQTRDTQEGCEHKENNGGHTETSVNTGEHKGENQDHQEENTMTREKTKRQHRRKTTATREKAKTTRVENTKKTR